MASPLLNCHTTTLCSLSKKLETLLPSRSCLRRVSFWENIFYLHYFCKKMSWWKEAVDCIFIFSVTEKWLKHLTLKIENETWDGVVCVCICVSVTLIILFIFQNTADLRQELVQPSRAQPLSTELWDSSLPTEMTGTSSIPTASSVITRTYTHKMVLQKLHPSRQ